MSQVEETPIMLQTRYRVKMLMEEELTWYKKEEASMRKSSLWKDLQTMQSLLLDVMSYIGDCARQNQIKLMEEIEEKVHLTAEFLCEAAALRSHKGAKNEGGKDMDALTSDVRRKVSRPLSSSSQAPNTNSLSEKLKEISSSLQSLIEKSESYKLQKGVILGSDMRSESHCRRELPKLRSLEEVEIIGRSDESEKLISVLLEPGKDEESPLQIVPIVGQEGTGKTTLARAVYDDDKIKNHFDHRIWVCASASFDAKQVLENICEALAPNRRAELESVDEILAVLLEELDGKSFFLVLDDVSGNEADFLPRLELLKDCLLKLNTTRRNKVVITTTSISTETAKEMNMHDPILLQKLSDNHCKAILQRMSGGIQIEDIEQSIELLTGGIPLAVKVLGGTIYNLKELQRMNEPEIINHLLQAKLVKKEDGDAPALNLSYSHLPQEVQRQCFAYMSIFPPNTPIEKGNIIQLWMAQGYAHIETEDTLNILLNCCLIEPAERDFNGKITSVRLAKMAWKLASNKLQPNITHLSVHAGQPLVQAPEAKTTKLHTFMSVGKNPVNYGEYDFESLKVLNLSKSQFNKWPIAFEKLVDLRYIDVSGTKVAELPESITQFIHLQTIRAINCSYLKRLPKDLSNLKKLRHLCIDPDNEAIREDGMPLGLDSLSCLQTLPLLVVAAKDPKRSKNILGIGPLTKIRGKMTVCNLEHLTAAKAEEWNLKEKNGIYELIYEWSMTNPQRTSTTDNAVLEKQQRTTDNEFLQRTNDNEVPEKLQHSDVLQRTNDNEVLEKLQPNEKLKSLTLQNFAGNEITMWKKVNSQEGKDTNFAGNEITMSKKVNSQEGKDTALHKYLVKLKLSNCNNCNKLPTLGTLPSLKELHLEGMDGVESIESEFYTEKSTGTAVADESGVILFKKLRKFTMMYLANLRSWSKPEGASNQVFPALEELRVEGCDKLISAPSHFQSLKRLHVERVNSGEPLANICSNLTTLTSVFISSVQNLQSLPEGILRNNPNLSSLRIWNCHELTEIPKPDTWGCSKSLQSLSINDCENLKSLPENLHNASSLIELILSQCNSLISIPSVDGLCSLRRLKIEWCRSMESLPSGLHSCTSLEHLMIKGCPSLTSVQDEGLSKLSSLCSVNILVCEKLTALPFRELLHYLTKLKRLEIEGFTEDPLGLTIEYPGLKGWARFKALPKPLQTQKIKGSWTINPTLLETFATKAVGFLEALKLFEDGVKAVPR